MRPSPFLLAIAALLASAHVTPAWSNGLDPITSNESPSQTTALETALSNLEKYSALQKLAGVQDPELAYAMRKALTIADLLVKPEGSLELSLCPVIQTTFFSEHPEEYELRMEQFLNQLNSSWGEIMGTIHASKTLSSSGLDTLALRALFTLGPDQPVTSRHAKVAVLASLLAPYSQGPTGDPLAARDLMRDHEEYNQNAAVDYTAIVTKGYLERFADGRLDSFFFLPILADSDRTNLIALSSDGTFLHSGVALFDVPGFAAAGTLMGGLTTPELQEKTVRLIFGNETETVIQATPQQIIGAMAQVIGEDQNQDPAALRILGEYGFSSLTQNPILRAVESAFAAMAEERPKDSIRNNINQAVAQALQPTWENLSQVEGADLFRKTFMKTFNALYRLIYNLSISLPNQNFTDGGFQLYQKMIADIHQPGIRIATPGQFQQLVLDAVEATKLALQPFASTQEIAAALKAATSSENFLKNVLWAYDAANQQESDPITHYQALSRTPMQSCDGDSPLDIDETFYKSQVQTYTPQDSKDLIAWCLKVARGAPSEMLPMNNSLHAFNFVPTNSDIESFLDQKMTVSQWLRNSLINPGVQIARKQIDIATLQAIANAFYTRISSLFTTPSTYQQLVQTLSAKPTTLYSFTSGLLKGVSKLLNLSKDQVNQVALILDSTLLQNLPPADLITINQTAIRFANTNWKQGTKNIYFCAYFNPRTLRIGFGSIYEDKTNLQPLDELAWVNQKQWEIDLRAYLGWKFNP